MLVVIGREGLWTRSAMDSGLHGLDWTGALASLPAGLDVDFAKSLLTLAEKAFLAAWWERAESERKKD